MEPILPDENYLDAYELIGCPVTEIQSMLTDLPINLGNRARPGITTNQVVQERAAVKIGKFLENLSVQNMSVAEILELNNLDNMPNDSYMLNRLKDICGKEAYREVYLKELLARDKRDSREREFPLEPIIEAVEAGTCRPPLIVELDNSQYVIDGRTRLYAAIASDRSIDVKVINDTNLKEYLEEINDY